MAPIIVPHRNPALEGNEELLEEENDRLRKGLEELLNDNNLVKQCVDDTGDPNLVACLAESIVSMEFDVKMKIREEEGEDLSEAVHNPNPIFTNRKTGKPLKKEEIKEIRERYTPCPPTVRDFTQIVRKLLDEEYGCDCLSLYEQHVHDANTVEHDEIKDMEDYMIDELALFTTAAIKMKYLVEKEECPFWYGAPVL